MRPIGVKPGTFRLRDGTTKSGLRTAGEWENAIVQHQETAHSGQYQPGCPACEEIKYRYQKDMLEAAGQKQKTTTRREQLKSKWLFPVGKRKRSKRWKR